MAKMSSFKKVSGGYSADLANQLLEGVSGLTVVGSGLVPQYVWDSEAKSYTDDLESYSLAVGAPEVEPFSVKLPAESSGDFAFGSHVRFDGLEACQVRTNVYFRARSVKVVK